MEYNKIKSIISIGEVVWDIFSDRQVLGGAPVNVAYHLSCLGLPALAISRIGDDELGRLTLDQLKALGVPVQGVQFDPELATGRVNVTVDLHNEPHFDIVAPAAWDNIDTGAALKLAGEDYVLVFGTLAQRDSRSRRTIQTLRQKASFSFYDVNLRPPFTTRELVNESLQAADMVKVNEDELLVLGRWFGLPDDDKYDLARTLRERFELQSLAVTAGKDGAWLLDGDDFFELEAAPVQVADTVGAGDAFFAAIIEGTLKERSWPECLERANRRGGYVASKNGATPPMPDL